MTGLMVVLGLAGCLAQQPTTAATDRTGDGAQAKLLASIQAEIGEARCTADAQCRTLPIGAKACGGPQQYLAYSIQASRAAQLQAWSGELATLARQANQQGGLMSNCMVVPDPGARCDAGRCSLRPSAQPMPVR